MKGDKEFKLENHVIGVKHTPFIVAEMSGNHKQSLDKALQIVDAVAQAGAHAIKLQTYTADTMTLKVEREEFYIRDPKSLWAGRHLYDLYHEAYTPWEWHKPIIERAKEKKLICFSTPFDETAVDFLETLEVPCYKIASFENTDIMLLKKVAKTGKPVFISTGMASLEDLSLMTNTLRNAQCDNFVLLKCTSAYPASPSDINLKTISHLSDMFDCLVGLSDHTMGIGVPIAAVTLGARGIEKHVCLSRAEGGVDSAFSLEPQELKLLVEETKCAWLSVGKVSYQCSKTEEKSKQFRRSIYFVKDLKEGELISNDSIRCVRPGYGLEPKYFYQIIGQRLKIAVSSGMPVKLEYIEHCQ